jgi:hypothetical protein
LEDLDTEVEINSAWEMIRENIKISAKESLGYFELKKHKPWFDDGCSELLYQRKQAKLQWLHDPSEINRDNLNNVRCEATDISGIKRGNIRKKKLMSLQRNSKNKNIRKQEFLSYIDWRRFWCVLRTGSLLLVFTFLFQ